MNDQGIGAWDADAVEMTTVDIEVTVTVNYNIDDEPQVDDPPPEGSYKIIYISAFTKTFSFQGIRVPWEPEVTPNGNEFSVYTGDVPVGDPLSDTPPFFRSLAANIIGEAFAYTEVGATGTWNVNYVELLDTLDIYTPPPDESGTLTCDIDADALSVRNGADMSFDASAGVTWTGDAPPGGFAFGGGSGSTTPVTVDITTLKDGASLDFGGVITITQTDPNFPVGFPDPDDWNVNSFNVVTTITITVS